MCLQNFFTTNFSFWWNPFFHKILVNNAKEDFFDVTQARDDDPQIKSYKVICWAWSPFFRKIMLPIVEEEQDFFDVTLAYKDDEQIEAHTVILLAWGLFFPMILIDIVEDENIHKFLSEFFNVQDVAKCKKGSGRYDTVQKEEAATVVTKVRRWTESWECALLRLFILYNLKVNDGIKLNVNKHKVQFCWINILNLSIQKEQEEIIFILICRPIIVIFTT